MRRYTASRFTENTPDALASTKIALKSVSTASQVCFQQRRLTIVVNVQHNIVLD